MITGIDHVQLAMPRGREDAARSFYAGLLGMTELAKPPVLAVRGGCWFASGAAVLHLGQHDTAVLVQDRARCTCTPSLLQAPRTVLPSNAHTRGRGRTRRSP